jgi:UDP:flavonoid glycosyltransferase YjiC (YdhE family)
MRILFSCVGAYGHFHPLVPLARALADREHEVAFATPSAFGERIEARGFRFFAAGLSQAELEEQFVEHRARLRELPISERRRTHSGGASPRSTRRHGCPRCMKRPRHGSRSS